MKLEKGPVKKYHIHMYAPGFTAAPELGPAQIFRISDDSWGDQGYDAHELNVRNVKMGNIIDYMIAKIGSISRMLIMWN